MTDLPVIPDYALLRCIGAGSYGEVWLARSLTGQYRAVKIVRRASFDNSRPFEREFAGIAKFEPLSRSHEGLIHILHIGHSLAGDAFFYVMELADDQNDGQRIDVDRYAPRTLASELAARHRMPIEECLRVGLALTEALAFLHEHGLVHRDIKPSNIILVNGVPKLADIGLVTAADQTKSFVGTEGYVPLEGPGSAPADLFSLGKMLYEMSTGNDRRQFPALPADLDGVLELNEVLLRACEPDVRHRYRTAREMHADLVQLQRGKSLRRLRVLRRWVPRLTRLAVPAALVLAILGFGGFIWREHHRQERQTALELVAEGDKWLPQNRLDHAMDCYLEARTQLDGNGYSPLIAELGLWELYRQAPPALNTIATPVAHAVAFLPDGRRALTGDDDGSVKLWDVATGQLLRSFAGHTQTVWAVATDGQRALTGGADGLLKLWEVETGRELHSWPARDGAILGIALLPDGRKALSAGADGLVKLWDLESSAEMRVLTGHVGSVFAVSVSAEGRQVLSGGADNSVRLWDLETGEQLHEFSGNHNPVYTVALSANGKFAVSGSVDGTVRLWDMTTGIESQSFSRVGMKAAVDSVAFSADGQHVLSGGADHTACLWDIPTGKVTRTFLGHRDRINSVCFNADSSRALTASQDGTLKVWDVSASLEARSVQAHDSPVRCIAVSGNGRVALSTAEDVKLWDLATMRLLQAKAELTNATCAALDADGGRAAFGFLDGAVKLWEIAADRVVPLTSYSNAVLHVQFSPDSQHVNAADREDDATRQLLKTIGAQVCEASHVQVAPDRQHVLVACADQTIHLWNVAKSQEERLYFGHAESILALAVSPVGDWFASGSQDTTVKLWSFDRKDELRTLTGHAAPVTAVACRPGEPGVLSGSLDGILYFWDLARPRHYLQRKRGSLAQWYEYRGRYDWAAALRAQDSAK